ncbi:hypothetical protein [Shumkonia mesophila]|uniref:hypothetical protein n=1 Tax=Shumkonia mesophila TaxID=2838854 RepID=UPI002934C2F3|nr:hypothetical protein [Shumkonia mesophila]
MYVELAQRLMMKALVGGHVEADQLSIIVQELLDMSRMIANLETANRLLAEDNQRLRAQIRGTRPVRAALAGPRRYWKV